MHMVLNPARKTCRKTMMGQTTFPTKVERKVVEKNRRNQMKTLYSHLYSLVSNPDLPNQQAVPLPDQIDEAIAYIKGLEAKLKVLREKKEQLVGSSTSPSKKRSYYNCTNFLDQHTTAVAEPPRIDIRETGSSMEIVLITGMVNQFIFSDAVRVLHEEGLEVLDANYSATSKGSFIHVLHAQMGDSSSGLEAMMVTERLNKLVNGCTSDALMLEPELWDFDTTSSWQIL